MLGRYLATSAMNESGRAKAIEWLSRAASQGVSEAEEDIALFTQAEQSMAN